MTRQVLVILHGWGSESQRWERVRSFLEKEGIDVYIPDLPGFGKADPPDTPWDIEGYVQWVERTLSSYERFFLLGHSFGGRIATLYALSHPEKIEKLVLSGTPIRPVRRSLFMRTIIAVGRMCSFLPGFSFLRKAFYSRVLGVTDYLRVHGVMKETFQKIIATDISLALARIQVPTLLIWGAKDPLTPVSVAREMEQHIPDSKLIVLKDIRHAPHLEIPETFASILVSHLRGEK